MDSGHILLKAIFEQLRAEGLHLSVRDYLDALAALEEFPEPFVALCGVTPATGHDEGTRSTLLGSQYRVRDRNEIVWMCQALWARTSGEERLVHRVITEEIGQADARLALRLYEHRIAVEQSRFPPFEEKPVPPVQRPDPVLPTRGKPATADARIETDAGDGPHVQSEDEWAAGIGAELDEAGQAALPTVSDLPIPSGPGFSMKAEPLMSALWLTALWRRLFMPKKSYDLSRIDVQETVRAASRTGYIAAPRYAIRHINTARLTVMIDASRYMQPWAAFQRMMHQTLVDGTSRLQQVSIAYFANVPGQRVYETDTLRRARALPAFLSDSKGHPVLIFGEAGTMEPRRRDFDRRMDQFFETMLKIGARPIVWLNPMPERRWYPPFRALQQRYPHTHCLSLNSEALLRAVDLLRGAVT